VVVVDDGSECSDVVLAAGNDAARSVRIRVGACRVAALGRAAGVESEVIILK